MSFFSDAESQQLTIQRMSLHIVGGGEEFVPRGELQVVHDQFLLGVLRSIASDAVHTFNEISTTRQSIERIATGDLAFPEGAQALAHQFHQLHDNGRTTEGAFFVFELTVENPEVRFYALVKYDYRAVLELTQDDGVATLREIVEALVNDKSAVQKAAIVRTNAGAAADELSTLDRMSRRKPDLTDYFQRYLEVKRSRSDEELTKEARGVVTEALRASKDHHGQPIPQGVARGIAVLRDAPTITEEVIRNAVWAGAGHPDDDAVRNEINRITQREISRRRLSECEFPTERRALPRAVKRRIKTVEGVSIEFDSDLEGRVVQMAHADGTTTITIETQEITQDDVVPQPPGRAVGQPLGPRAGGNRRD